MWLHRVLNTCFVVSAMTNTPITLNTKWPIVKIRSHVVYPCHQNKCYLDIVFRQYCISFFFFFCLCKPFIKSWLLSALTSPSTVFHLGKHPPNRNYCVLLCFSQDCQGFQNFAYGHPMKPSHLLPFSSTHLPSPLSLSFFPPSIHFSPLFTLPSQASFPLSQHEVWTVM